MLISFDLVLLLSFAGASNLQETCSKDEPSFTDCDKGDEVAQTSKGMTKAMSMLAANYHVTERVNIDGSEGIFVSIKTTEKYHGTRLPPLVLTWLQTLQPQQVGVVIAPPTLSAWNAILLCNYCPSAVCGGSSTIITSSWDLGTWMTHKHVSKLAENWLQYKLMLRIVCQGPWNA